MKKSSASELPIIGWREWVSIPSLNISKIKVKVDSGARTSSLHAFNIRVVKKGEKSFVNFKVRPLQKDSKTIVDCSAEMIDRRRIKSSDGKVQIRPIIRTQIVLMNETFDIELSLTSRAEMGFRMLLGREAIRNRFTIATGVSFMDPKLVEKKVKKISSTKKGSGNKIETRKEVE